MFAIVKPSLGARRLAKPIPGPSVPLCPLGKDCMTRCEKGLPIAEILRYERYARDYHELERARGLYARLSLDAGECSACGACLPHCPQGLKIPEKLRQAHRIVS